MQPIVIDDQQPVDVQARAIIGEGPEGVDARACDLELALEAQHVVVNEVEAGEDSGEVHIAPERPAQAGGSCGNAHTFM